ncbi:histidine phosphatase family protein [Stieleria sp. TO1_6]|uniref:SixA phosphatase family protein n=1 Tax=Stieleria tagensis TaxID=2956795 RepID=UPI00209A68DA|nr:histidine phosphatase family protein [Stieleria tagensis]MCO8124358.1 histidine phosphatase family protein [Stieleria tagensis]
MPHATPQHPLQQFRDLTLMESKLILMRHAKSGHDDPSLADHDRPLAGRGRRACPLMASWLADQDCIPDLILCSSAIRTRQTAQLLLDAWQHQPSIEYHESLYLSGPDTILDVASSEHADARRVMVLAHNPGISMLATILAGQSLELVTAAIAVFTASGQSADADPLDRLNLQSRLPLTSFGSPKSLSS